MTKSFSFGTDGSQVTDKLEYSREFGWRARVSVHDKTEFARLCTEYLKEREQAIKANPDCKYMDEGHIDVKTGAIWVTVDSGLEWGDDGQPRISTFGEDSGGVDIGADGAGGLASLVVAFQTVRHAQHVWIDIAHVTSANYIS